MALCCSRGLPLPWPCAVSFPLSLCRQEASSKNDISAYNHCYPCRSGWSCMMSGGQSLWRRIPLPCPALPCPWMASCLPQHQSEGRLSGSSPPQTAPNCRQVLAWLCGRHECMHSLVLARHGDAFDEAAGAVMTRPSRIVNLQQRLDYQSQMQRGSVFESFSAETVTCLLEMYPGIVLVVIMTSV